MLYPIFSFEDGTEVTASKPDVNGKIFLYIEKFDINNHKLFYLSHILVST